MPKPTPAARIDCDDLLSRRGSELLAAAINTYWRERGYTVNARGIDCDGHWGVRSDLVAGLPRPKDANWSGRPLKSLPERRAEFLG